MDIVFSHWFLGEILIRAASKAQPKYVKSKLGHPVHCGTAPSRSFASRLWKPQPDQHPNTRLYWGKPLSLHTYSTPYVSSPSQDGLGWMKSTGSPFSGSLVALYPHIHTHIHTVSHSWIRKKKGPGKVGYKKPSYTLNVMAQDIQDFILFIKAPLRMDVSPIL